MYLSDLPAGKFSMMNIVLPLVMVSAMGPYLNLVGFGVRVEQMAVYGALFLAIFDLLIRRRSLLISWPIMGVCICFLFIAMWSSWGMLNSPYNSARASQDILASLDNLLLPVATLFSILLFNGAGGNYGNTSRVLIGCLHILIAVLCINTLLSLAQALGNTPQWLDFFHPEATARGTVASRAAQSGRYSGVFNQPFEAGMAYSLGIAVWAALATQGYWRNTFLAVTTGLMLVIGGLMPVSKAFMLGGLPLAIIYFVIEGDKKGNRKWGKLVILISLIGLALWIIIGGMSEWRGRSRIVTLLTADGGSVDNFVRFYTAERFGQDAEYSIMQKIKVVMNEAPLIGYGLGHGLVTDNAYYEMLVYGGIPALVIYLMVLALFGRIAIKSFRHFWEGRLLLFIIILVCAGGMGAPIMTLNRFGTMVILVAGLLVVTLQRYLYRRHGRYEMI